MSNIKLGTVVGVAAALALIIGLVVGVAIHPGAVSTVSPTGNSGGLVHNIQEIFSAGLKAGEPAVEVINSSGIYVGTTQIGGGSLLSKFITGTASYNPPSLADGVVATTTVTITGAAAGDNCNVGFTLTGAIGGINIGCQISTANTALVTMDNESGVTQDNATGTLKVAVWQ